MVLILEPQADMRHATTVIDTLAITYSELTRLIDSLDKRAGSAADQARRENQRTSFRVGKIIVVVHHPTGEITRHLVAPRDISSGGFGVLYGGFIYPGTRCDIELTMNDDTVLAIPCMVVHCKPVAGRIHYLGLKSTQSIDVPDVVARFRPSYRSVLELYPKAKTCLFMGNPNEHSMPFLNRRHESTLNITIARDLAQARELLFKKRFDTLVFDLKFLRNHLKDVCDCLDRMGKTKHILGHFICVDAKLVPLESVLRTRTPIRPATHTDDKFTDA